MDIINILLKARSDLQNREKTIKWFDKGESLRKENANWNYINSLPKNIIKALKTYIETGDLLYSSKIGNISALELNEYRIQAGIPYTIGY
ncbi:MAG: hypothetical protein ACE5J3_02345 [Methanosarcinales archaeon]